LHCSYERHCNNKKIITWLDNIRPIGSAEMHCMLHNRIRTGKVSRSMGKQKFLDWMPNWRISTKKSDCSILWVKCFNSVSMFCYNNFYLYSRLFRLKTLPWNPSVSASSHPGWLSPPLTYTLMSPVWWSESPNDPLLVW